MSVPVSGPINLDGQTALVSGAAGGIGLETCRALAREGAKVACMDLADPEAAVKAVVEQGGQALSLRADVRKAAEIKKAVAQVKDQWGRLDILVASHGILSSARKPIPDYSEDEWDLVQEVNVKGSFLLMQEAWAIMEAQGGGKMVFLGSIAGRAGGVIAGPAYCTSKGGLHSMVKWAARNGAAKGIYVNGIAPGPVVTPMIDDEPYKDEMVPLGRLGQPQDIAEACLFLASPAANFITGAILDVNGGLFMG